MPVHIKLGHSWSEVGADLPRLLEPGGRQCLSLIEGRGMPIPLKLTAGDHLHLLGLVSTLTVRVVSDQPARVALNATLLKVDGTGSTSLSLNVEGAAALRLYEDLGDEIRRMGWQHYISCDRPV